MVKFVIGAIQVDRSIPISSLRDGILESASTLAASTTTPPAKPDLITKFGFVLANVATTLVTAN